jgi:ribosomal protein S18 acetylase RimI-like enzyme
MPTAPITVRVATAPTDIAAISGIDTSFATDLVYRVKRDGLAFVLNQEPVEPAVKKTFPLPKLPLSDRLFVACSGEEIVGVAQLEFEAWNGRARIEHLYVTPSYRGQGVGRALVEALDQRAREEEGVRCLWLETSNINHPGIQFYRRMGFELCGLDETLYQAGSPDLIPGEVALFFTFPIATGTA